MVNRDLGRLINAAILQFQFTEHSIHSNGSADLGEMRQNRQRKFIALLVVQSLNIYIYILYIYMVSREECKNFGRVFLMLKYADITQNTYI
jgi:hypothetical protein